MKPIAIAIAGLGKIACDQHVPSLRADDRFEIVATVDPHHGLEGTPRFVDLDAMLASDVRVDAVAICTPPQARGAIARAAIAAGLHVLLEKPPAATLTELADLRSRADSAGLTLFAAWHSRFAPMVEPARAWLADRIVTRGHIRWREDVRRWHPGQAWLWAPGGLGVFDPGINAFSILTRLLRQPPIVAAARLDIPSNAHTPIAAELALLSGRAEIAVDLSFLQTGPQTWDMTFQTECGSQLHLSNGGSRLSIDHDPPIEAADREYPELYARFADLITRGSSEADPAPLRLVADALLVGDVRHVAAFVDSANRRAPEFSRSSPQARAPASRSRPA